MIFLSFLYFCLNGQEIVHISCKADLDANQVLESYYHTNVEQLQFTLDQTQTLSSFSGYYWKGKKRCKIKKKKLNVTTDFSNQNNPITHYSYPIQKGKEPSKIAFNYETVRNEVMYLSAFQFDNNKTYKLDIDVPNDYMITHSVDTSIQTSAKKTESINKYIFQKQAGIETSEYSILQLMVHLNTSDPNDYFSAWYLELLEDQTELSAESKAAINEIVKTGATKTEKAKLFYQYVRDKIQYYDVESGIKMVQPENVNTVLRNKYGDCKDVTLLLHVGLQYLGCNSYFGLLNLVENPKDVYYLSSFNHAICVLEDAEQFLFLDATDQNSQFGKISKAMINRKVLMLSKNETKSTLILPKNNF